MDFPPHQTMARSPMPMPMYQPLTGIDNPHNNDVLCGRGVTTNRHKGNESFRALVNCNKELYVTSTKKQKMKISRSIVEAVRSLDPPGRFLEKDQASGKWFDIGDKKAVEKTSQALRDGAAGLRKQLSQDLNDPDFLAAVFDMDVGPAEKKVATAAKKDIKKVPPKKGHRRVKSNPVVITSTKVKPLMKRRLPGPEIPMSPRSRHSLSIPMGQPPQSPIMSPRSAGGSPRPMMSHSNEFGAYDFGVSHRRAHSQGSAPVLTTSSPVNFGVPRSPRAPPSRSGSFEYYEHQEHRRPPPAPFGSPSHSGHHYPPPPMSPSGYPASPHTMHPRSPYQQPPPISPRWSPRSGYQRSQPSLSPHPYMHSSDYHHHRQSPDTRRRQPMSPREHYARSHPSHPPPHYPPHPHHQPSSHLAVPTLGGERASSHHQQSHPRRHPMSPGRYPPVSPRFHSSVSGSPLPIDFTPPQSYSARRVESSPYRDGPGPPLPIRMDEEKHTDEKKDDDHQMLDQEQTRGNDGAPFDEKPSSSSPAAVADVANSSDVAKENLMLSPSRSGKKDDDYPSDEDPADGSVSPLPFDHHEDPSSLMELPENILSLPISPCGPNDGEI